MLKIAVVHDWLPVFGGAERVLEQILAVFPNADLFSLVDLLPKEERAFLGGRTVHTSFLQKFQWVRNNYRKFLPLMPLAVEQFDLSSYQLVISSSYAVAKGVITGPGQLHVSYCHSPMRYAWDLQHQYLRESGLQRGPLSWAARALLHYMRGWDVLSQQRVDGFLANSKFIGRRIRKMYGRESTVVYPPVNTEAFDLGLERGSHYVTASRLVPYKMIGTIIEAFNRMPDRELHVIGDGPEFARLAKLAKPNVRMLGHQSFASLKDNLQSARAFVFAALEDFGIAPVEAQACGTPVLAFGQGGSAETVREGETGLFHEQSPEAIMHCVEEFESRLSSFDPAKIRRHALRFSAARFREEFLQEVTALWMTHFGTELSGELEESGQATALEGASLFLDNSHYPAPSKAACVQ